MRNIDKDHLIIRMQVLKRLLNKDEILEFYVENIMRANHGCKLSPYAEYDRTRSAWLEGKVELSFNEIQQRSMNWYRQTLGSLILEGRLEVILYSGSMVELRQ